MLKALDLIHRWTGGIVGLVLAVLGASGALLVFKDDWIGLPHANDPRVSDPAAIGAATARLLEGAQGGESLIYASDRFGLIQLRTGEAAGAYVDQSGQIVARWSSLWERPELWLFDLHHHLFAGQVGETVAGVAGICALLFVVTGAIVWWRTRRTFRPRAWPKRLTRPSIVWQHRDLGIVVAPLLLLSALSGTMMVFRPVADVVLSPLGPRGTIEAALKPPTFAAGQLAPDLDWRAVVVAAHARFPDAQIRILSLPKKPGDPIAVRMKRAGEWLPNGRSSVWFDPATGAVLGSRDALAMPGAAQAFNMAYPLHAAKVGGLAYRLPIATSGLALAMLGTFAVWSFWFRRPRRRVTRLESGGKARDKPLPSASR
jgi:uncharacterized iron-regulated membrane protein